MTIVSGSCLQSGGNVNSTSGSVITLNSTSCSAGIAAGATVSVGFSATNPTANFNFTVATSANATAAKSPTVTISTSPPTVSAASLSLGVNTTYTISNVGSTSSSNGGASWATLTGTAGVLELSASNAGLNFASGPASYSVTYTPSGGTAATDVVTAATPGSTPNIVFLTLTTAISSGGVVNITALGTNPATAGTSTMTITPGNGTGAAFASNGSALTTNSLSFGTGVTAVTLSISPLVSAASATYTLTFKATTAVPVGGTISLTETAGPTSFTGISGVLVSDATANWRQVTTTPGSEYRVDDRAVKRDRRRRRHHGHRCRGNQPRCRDLHRLHGGHVQGHRASGGAFVHHQR